MGKNKSLDNSRYGDHGGSMRIIGKVIDKIHIGLTLIAVFIIMLPVYVVCYPIFYWKGELPEMALKTRDKIANTLYPYPKEAAK